MRVPNIIVLAALVLVTCSVLGQNWTVEPVLSEPGSWIEASLAVDSLGVPRVCFGLSGFLGYGRRGTDSWEFQWVDSGLVAYSVDLRLDEDENPHVAYIGTRVLTPEVRYGRSTGEGWTVETVFQGTPASSLDRVSLSLAREGMPHVTFIDTPRVVFSQRVGDTWQTQAVPIPQEDSLRRLTGAALALDSADRPAVGVSRYKYGVTDVDDSLWVSVLEYDGSLWTRFDVDSVGGWGPWDFWPLRMVNDPLSNRLHVVYSSGRYAVGRGPEWQLEKVGLTVGNVWCDLDVRCGRPYIACSSPMDPLEHQWRWAGGWESELVANTVALNPSIAVDDSGRPHVTYFDDSDTLHYARRLFVGAEEPRAARPTPTGDGPTVARAAALAEVRGRVLNAAGQEVGDPGRLAPGLYFVRPDTDQPARMRKLVILK